MTTNGVQLAEHARALYEAGLHRVTVSLDTLRPERFRALTRRDVHKRVLSGIEAVRRVGFRGLKIDTDAPANLSLTPLAGTCCGAAP